MFCMTQSSVSRNVNNLSPLTLCYDHKQACKVYRRLLHAALWKACSMSNVMTLEGAGKGPVRGTVRERGGGEGGAL